LMLLPPDSVLVGVHLEKKAWGLINPNRGKYLKRKVERRAVEGGYGDGERGVGREGGPMRAAAQAVLVAR